MIGKLTVLTLISFISLTFAQVKFACVDTNRILQESKLVAQAQSELRGKLVEYQAQLSEKEKKLQELKKQIESKAVSQKIKEEKIKEYQKIESEARQVQEKAQKELGEMKQRLETMVFNRVREAAEKLAKEKGYTGVMDCGVFIYKDPEIDITTDVIQLVDKSVQKK